MPRVCDDSLELHDTHALSGARARNEWLAYLRDLATSATHPTVRHVLDDYAARGADCLKEPTLLGTLFQNRMNAEKRRQHGAHYTAEHAILKLIGPLFLDELQETFDRSCSEPAQLTALLRRTSHMRFFDPACGCGDFLVITLRAIRTLEYRIIQRLVALLGQWEHDEKQAKKQGNQLVKPSLGHDTCVQKIQFYGIEDDPIACEMARVSFRMMQMRLDLHFGLQFGTQHHLINSLLREQSHREYRILRANALGADWADICPPCHLNAGTYIMGNPPFLGKRYQTAQQKTDLRRTLGKAFSHGGNLDYASGWFAKAASYMNDPRHGSFAKQCKAAFITTESLVQGEQAPTLWQGLSKGFGVAIDIAGAPFRWSSDASAAAAVRCVVIGFSKTTGNTPENGGRAKRAVLIRADGIKQAVDHINEYLLPGPWVFLRRRNRCLCDVPAMNYGSFALDDGHFTLSQNEYEYIIEKNPAATPWIRPFLGSVEFLNGIKRYCVWLCDIAPEQLGKIPLLEDKVRSVKHWRMTRRRGRTIQAALTPTLFAEIRQPSCEYLALPVLSSERRSYFPIGFLPPTVIASNQLLIIPGASLYMFGILSSHAHQIWLRTVGGRLGLTYRYSASIVYNNFPWPQPEAKNAATVEASVCVTANAIIQTRNKYKNKTLAQLYDPDTMPDDLRLAHENNDRAVWLAYNHEPSRSDNADNAQWLLRRYHEMTQ